MLRSAKFILILMALAGCANPLFYRAVPEEMISLAAPENVHEAIRFWGDEFPKITDEIIQGMDKEMTARLKHLRPSQRKSESYLALSGGGENGAYGAGLLAGWSAHGTRPKFALVTGISTGAIIAPFAFLGKKYDRQLEEIFTSFSTAGIIETGIWKIISGALWGVSLSDTVPLARNLRKYITQEMLDEIGSQARAGRTLFIGTTNLDAQRPVIWNIGTLANSDHPNALALFHDIIRASAAIPGIMPPIVFHVEAAGKKYSEAHIDGGTTSQVFLYPIDLGKIRKKLKVNPKRYLYVIRNSKIAPEYDSSARNLFSISSRAIDTLIKNQGNNDLVKLLAIAHRDGLDYNLAYIPATFKEISTEAFDREYMQKLFQLGYEQGRRGYQWKKLPPSFDEQKTGK